MKFTMWVIVALAVVLGATVRIEQDRLTAVRARSAQTALAAVNAEASRDSTRVLIGASRAMSQMMGDSVRVYRRRVLQVSQQRDALDKAIGDERVALDPIQLEARVSCGEPDSSGIRSANVVASAPSWATVTFGRVEQSPDLCRSPALVRSSKRSRLFRFEPLVIGGGRIVTPDGRGAWGFFAGSGVHVWI